MSASHINKGRLSIDLCMFTDLASLDIVLRAIKVAKLVVEARRFFYRVTTHVLLVFVCIRIQWVQRDARVTHAHYFAQ